MKVFRFFYLNNIILFLYRNSSVQSWYVLLWLFCFIFAVNFAPMALCLLTWIKIHYKKCMKFMFEQVFVFFQTQSFFLFSEQLWHIFYPKWINWHPEPVSDVMFPWQIFLFYYYFIVRCFNCRKILHLSFGHILVLVKTKLWSQLSNGNTAVSTLECLGMWVRSSAFC